MPGYVRMSGLQGDRTSEAARNAGICMIETSDGGLIGEDGLGSMVGPKWRGKVDLAAGRSGVEAPPSL